MENNNCNYDNGEIDAEILAFLDTVEIPPPTLTTIDVINDTKAIVPMRIEKKYIDVSDRDILFPIFWAQADYGQFYVFESNAQFLQYLNQLEPEARKFHEVVNGMRPHRIIIDIDYVGDNLDIKYIGNTMSRGIIDCFNEYYENMAVIGVDDLIIKNASSNKKFSAHYIIKGYKVQDYHEAKEFVQYLTTSVPFGNKIDMGVYATKHNFRTVGSVKDGRTFRVISQHEAQDAFVTHTDDDDDGEGEQLLPSMVEVQRAIAPQVQAAVNINVAEILAACRDHLVGWQYRSFGGTRILFDRSPGEVVPECTICKRFHDHDNALFLSIWHNRVYKCCFRNRTRRELIYTSGKELTVRPKLTMQQKTESLNRFKAADQSGDRLVPRIEFNGDDVFASESAMGTGKTFALAKHLKAENYEKVIMGAFRCSFTDEKSDQLGLEDYRKFKNNAEIPSSARQLIIQYESMHKIQCAEPPDLFILDEIESILDQIFTEKTTNNYKVAERLRECWNKFQWLLQYSKRVILMDANLSKVAKLMIKLFRPDVCVQDYVNKYQPWKDVPMYLYNDHKCLFNAVTNDAGKFVACSNSKKWLKAINEKLNASRKILLVCKDTSDAFKLAIKNLRVENPDLSYGETVNKYVSQYDCFLYSPTYLAGCSIESPEFSRMYSHFTNKTTPAQCVQMMGRVRCVKEFNLSLTVMPGVSMNEEEIIEFMKDKHQLGTLRIPENLLDFEYDRAGDRIFRHTEDPRFVLLIAYLANRMNAKNNFIVEFAKIIGKCGGTFFPVETNAAPDYADMVVKVDMETAEQIALADVNLELEEHPDDLATKKAILCNLYEVAPADVTKDFVRTYAKAAVMKKFKTLKELKHWDSIDQFVRYHDRRLAEYAVKNGADAVDMQAQSNESSRVIIAMDALKILNIDTSTNNFEGEFMLKRAELEAHLRLVPAFVLRYSVLLRALFDIKNNRLANPAQWDFKKRLSFINGIINSVFGIELKMTNKRKGLRDNYKLKMMAEFKYCAETTKYRPSLKKQDIKVEIEAPADGDQNIEAILDI